jgi:hypothetical protein
MGQHFFIPARIEPAGRELVHGTRESRAMVN